MAIIKGIAANDLIKELLELTGKQYSNLVTGVTVIANIDNAVTVEVRMIAEESDAD